MKRMTIFCALALTGCSGAQLKELRDRNTFLGRQIVDKNKDLGALQSKKSDLEGQISDLEDKLKAAQIRIDDLAKSNKDLADSMQSGQGELSAKIKQLVAEKDELSRKLNDLQREKIVGDRVKTRLIAKRDAELATLKQELDESKAADKKKQEERSARLAQAHEELGTLADSILKPLQGDRAAIVQDGESVVVTLQEPLLFETQKAKLTEDGAGVLDRLGAALHKLPSRLVRVQAHSDNAQIKWDLLGRFTSHWDLTAARATAVARYLHEHAGLDPRNLVAEGYGEFRPAKPNDTPEGRAANRRLVLVVEPAR
jgi:flagellar motor protein MotB